MKRALLAFVLGATSCATPAPPEKTSPAERRAAPLPHVEDIPDAHVTDSASPRASSDPDAGPAAPACGTKPWTMYAHDGARTSASDGCVDGPLTIAWSFKPRGVCGYESKTGRVQHAIADGEAVFASGDCGGAPAVWRIDGAGSGVWTMSRADYSRASWPALMSDAVVSTDDGVFVIDRATGKWRGRELDVWGEAIVDGDRLYVDNTWQLDGAGPFVGRLDTTLHWVWKASRFDGAKGKNIADVGGIALDGGIVVHAAAAGPRGAPTLSAHDAETGDRKWLAKGTWPESAPSIRDGRVHVIERWSNEKNDRLVARDLASGDLVWSQTIGWARGTPPALTPKHVLIHARDAVQAFDRASGAPAWSVPLPRTTPLVQSMTTLAVALGSGTVVVTSEARVIVLRLEDGKEVWSGAVAKGPGAIAGSPVVVGRHVYVVFRTLENMGTVVRLDPG